MHGDHTAPLLREAVAYWRGLCVGHAIPASADFLDGLPAHLVPNLMIFDCLPDDLLVRFHGSALIARRGEDQTGRSWLQANSQLRRAPILQGIRGIIDFRCALVTEADFITSTRRVVRVDALSLPLDTAPGRPPRVFNISSGRDTMDFDERATGWHGPIQPWWLDVGFGVPNVAPMAII